MNRYIDYTMTCVCVKRKSISLIVGRFLSSAYLDYYCMKKLKNISVKHIVGVDFQPFCSIY